jgi:hypothetical protein
VAVSAVQAGHNCVGNFATEQMAALLHTPSSEVMDAAILYE